jgi:hypothetical protein
MKAIIVSMIKVGELEFTRLNAKVRVGQVALVYMLTNSSDNHEKP